MATRFQNRRTLLLAIVLALIAAGTLCVWGAAAAGFTFSSPALQAFFEAITGRGDEDLAQVGNGDNGGPSNGIMPGNGEGDDAGGETGNGNGNGSGAGNGEECLLGLICLDAAVRVGGNGNGGDINIDLDRNLTGQTGRTRCFLGLI